MLLYRMGFYSKALESWRDAAQAGDGGAAFRLGTAYLDGVVTKRNPKEAIKWIKLGAKLGDARAESELGAIYDCQLYKCSTLGLKKSPRLAAQFYLSAARKGEPQSQYNIAVLLEEGIGIKQNYVEAYKFYTLAIENDFATFAHSARSKLAQKMSRAEIELAKLKVEAFMRGADDELSGL